MNPVVTANDRLYFRIILAISIAIPVLVALLLYIPGKENMQHADLSFLPRLNAIINSTVSVLLVAGYIAIRNQRKTTHRALMLTAFLLSGVFLISYVTYHTYMAETPFGGQGWMRPVYFFLLITHIVLATAIVPMVLLTIYHSFSGRFEKHRKIARWTFPLWLYVSITGVVVYLLIAPYYPY